VQQEACQWQEGLKTLISILLWERDLSINGSEVTDDDGGIQNFDHEIMEAMVRKGGGRRMIRRETAGNVEVLRLDRGKVNAMDVELLQALDDQLVALEAEPWRAVVLTGEGRAFSAGLDLQRLVEGGADYVSALLEVLNRLLLRLLGMSRPTVAAINGHAIAGGCLLSCTCDARLMASGVGRIGVTELLVGVPFPTAGLEPVREVVDGRFLRRLVYESALLSAEEAYEIGLVDEVLAPEALLPRAQELGERLAGIRPAVFAMTKRQLTAPLLGRIERLTALHESDAEELWLGEEALASVRRFVETTL
jgi:enoyl-CoA hydratase